MQQNIECPIDFELTNQNKVRGTAGLVLLLAIIFIITESWLSAALLASDFLLRAFNLSKFSLLSGVSAALIDLLGIETIPVNQKPKIFAARMGAIMSIIIFAVALAGFSLLSKGITVILSIFALLEFAVGFCTGCYVYTFLNKFYSAKNNNTPVNILRDKNHVELSTH